MITNLKVIIADDSPFMRQYLIGFLHEAGITDIVEAGNGKTAIEAFTKYKPDIVFIDLIMPVMTGVEALKILVKQGAKVIVISAVGQQEVIDQALKDGASAYFIKPFFTTEEILAKIKETLAL